MRSFWLPPTTVRMPAEAALEPKVEGVGVACEERTSTPVRLLKESLRPETWPRIARVSVPEPPMTESALEAGLGVEGDAVVLVTADDGEDACGGSAGAEGEGVGVACEGENLDAGEIIEGIVEA